MQWLNLNVSSKELILCVGVISSLVLLELIARYDEGGGSIDFLSILLSYNVERLPKSPDTPYHPDWSPLHVIDTRGEPDQTNYQ